MGGLFISNNLILKIHVQARSFYLSLLPLLESSKIRSAQNCILTNVVYPLNYLQ